MLPGITAATLADHAPGPGGRSLGVLTVPGFAPSDGRPFLFMNWTLVEPGFFATLRIPLLAGRDFSDADHEGGQPVAIVGEAAATRFWPGREAVGQSLLLHSTNPDSTSPQLTRILVVGVARDLKFQGPGTTARLDVYMPLRQRYSRELTLLARRDPGVSNAGALRTLVSSMDPNLPVLIAQTLESQQSGPVDTQLRVAATVAGSVGLLGVLLAAMGTYGVTAYAMTRRTREMAIRLSLGARTTNVVALVLRQGMRLVGIGCAIGLALGLGAGRLLSASRFGVPAADPLVFAGAAALLIGIGFVACFVPVLRASRINPTEAPRYE